MDSFITELDQLDNYILKIRSKGVPDIFDKNFLEEIGFSRTSSLLYVSLFRMLDLISEDGRPTSDYSKFVQSEAKSRIILANKIRQSYAEVFKVEKQSHLKSKEEVRGVFQEILKGDKSLAYIWLISDTFHALSNFADWEAKKVEEYQKTIIETQKPKPDKKPSEQNDAILEIINDALENSYKVDIQAGNDTYDEVLEELINGKVSHNDPFDLEESALVSKLKIPEVKNDINIDSNDSNIVDDSNAYTIPLKPDNKEFLLKALTKKAEMLQRLKRYEEAVSAFDRVLDFCKRSDSNDNSSIISHSYFRKGEVLEKLHLYDGALSAYDNFIQLNGVE